MYEVTEKMYEIAIGDGMLVEKKLSASAPKSTK